MVGKSEVEGPIQSKIPTRATELRVSDTEQGALLIHLVGDWTLGGGLPSPTVVAKHIGTASQLRRVTLDATELADWDSGLLAFLVGVQETCRSHNLDFDAGNLPEG